MDQAILAAYTRHTSDVVLRPIVHTFRHSVEADLQVGSFALKKQQLPYRPLSQDRVEYVVVQKRFKYLLQDYPSTSYPNETSVTGLS